MSRFRKIMSSTLAAATVCGAVASTSAPAEARGYGGAIAAGIIGGAALGAIAADASAPRYYVGHRRTRVGYRREYVDTPCGCVVRTVRYYY